jgi:hypothetical protein
MMQTDKGQETIDQSGYLTSIELSLESQSGHSKMVVKAFQDLFKKTEPAPLDFDPNQARREALQKKHGL